MRQIKRGPLHSGDEVEISLRLRISLQTLFYLSSGEFACENLESLILGELEEYFDEVEVLELKQHESNSS
jgi:hypothetical protein